MRVRVRTSVVPPPPPWEIFTSPDQEKLPDTLRVFVESETLARVHTYTFNVTVTEEVPVPTDDGDCENS
ncbi:hypothetical protein GCM10009526_24250 [Glutamicibacter creatinolyticus]